MNVNLKLPMKQMLPLAAVASLTISTALAGQNKSQTVVRDFDKIEYLQADKYEKQGADRIEAGLTQKEAYKDESLKAKFQQANLDGDYEINHEEAMIYNWKSGNNVVEFENGVMSHGLTLKGFDRSSDLMKVYPSFYIYPEQEFSGLKMSAQKKLFKEIDLNSDQKTSATEILRYIKSQELNKYNSLITKSDDVIVEAQKNKDDKWGAIIWSKAFILSFLAFSVVAGIVDALSKTRKHIQSGILAALLTTGISAGSDIIKNNKYWSTKLEEAVKEKENTVPQREQAIKELNYLDEQLRAQG